MYPFFRLATTVLQARRRPPLAPGDESRLDLRVWLGDIDVYPELNNGRHLMLMDLGRVDLAVRSGLWSQLRPRRWGLVTAAASVRYRHRVPLFGRLSVHSRIVGRDRLWFYVHQEIRHQGRLSSSALIRSGLAAHGGLVPTADILAALGDTTIPEQVPDWVAAWLSADALRPWDDGDAH
jgi:acyl-CoA thioesterase FadM